MSTPLLIKSFPITHRKEMGKITITAKDNGLMDIILFQKLLTEVGHFIKEQGVDTVKNVDINRFIFNHEWLPEILSPMPKTINNMSTKITNSIRVRFHYECACCDEIIKETPSSWTKLRDFLPRLLTLDTEIIDTRELTGALTWSGTGKNVFADKLSSPRVAFNRLKLAARKSTLIRFRPIQDEYGLCSNCFSEMAMLIDDFNSGLSNEKELKLQRRKELAILERHGFVEGEYYQYVYADCTPDKGEKGISHIVSELINRDFILHGEPNIDPYQGRVFQAMINKNNPKKEKEKTASEKIKDRLKLKTHG